VPAEAKVEVKTIIKVNNFFIFPPSRILKLVITINFKKNT